jgi:AraC-like DNA-binding protein
VELNLFNIIDIIIVFVSLLFAFFLLTTKEGNRLSNILIALFLVMSAQDSGAGFVGHYIYPNYPNLGILISLTIFFEYPLVYLYIRSVIYSDFKLKWIHLLHLLPFIVNVSLFIPRFFSVDLEAKHAFLEEMTSGENFEIRFNYLFLHIQIVFYLILAFIAIRKYKKLLLENFSNASLFHYRWLFQLVMLLTAAVLLGSIKNVFMFMHAERAYEYSQLASNLLVLGFTCWLVIRALKSPGLFKRIDSRLQLSKTMSKTPPAESSPSLGDREEHSRNASDKISFIDAYMEKSQPYLEPSLSLYDLATQLALSTRELSLIINQESGMHFFDYVNGFRIKRAMEILEDQDKQDLTILEILYEVGFNSKSSFNTAFKKYTKLTPTEYRKKYSLSMT